MKVIKMLGFLLFFSCKLLDSDQELYKNFPLVISERWQQEVAETVYDAVNADTDKIEARKRAKNKQLGHEEGNLSLHFSHLLLLGSNSWVWSSTDSRCRHSWESLGFV